MKGAAYMNKGIKYSGHTMGTPNLDIYGAIKLFKNLGFDGVEVRVANNGQIDSESITDEEVRNIRLTAAHEGMEFSCLTSYYQNFMPAQRESVIANLCRIAQIACLLDCPLIRVYGGVEPYNQAGVWFNDVWSYTVTGLQEVARYAAALGVGLCVETHIGSLTMSVRDCIKLIDDVNMNNVGMLFDYAWVELAGAETGADAVRRAARYISHVHIKDWKLESRTPLKKTSCLMGEGTVNWTAVIPVLKEIGYTGYISDEYEKYWYPADLPEPEVGMAHNLAYVKNLLV